MTHTAAVIARRRIAVGLSERDLASALGISLEAYGDLERRDDELTESVTLLQAQSLAQLLGTNLLTLLSLPDEGPQRSLTQLAAELRHEIRSGAKAVEDIETNVGWELGPFLESPHVVAQRNPIMFLQDLAEYTKVSCHFLVVSANAA